MTDVARELVEDFLPGWLGGGPARVGEPLGPAGLDALGEALAGAPAALGELCARRAGVLAPVDGPLPFGPADAPLVLVLHNLLALSDAALSAAPARPLARAGAVRFTLSVARRLRPPRNRAGALAAYGLLAPLPDAVRLDTAVRFWAGRLRFTGREAPRWAVALPRLRRVRTERLRVPMLSGLDADQRTLLDRLLLASPLTDLTHPELRGAGATPGSSGFTFGATSRWLTDPELARGVVYAWAEAPDPARVGGILAHAVLVRAEASSHRQELRRLLHALYHLHLVLRLQGGLRGQPDAAPPAPSAAAEPDPRRWHAALFRVLHRDRDRFGVPPPADLGPDLARRVAAYAASLESLDLAGEEQALLQALRPHFDPAPLPPAPQARALAADTVESP